ncbi:MAG: DUF4956 domain-containing protein [Gemmatimonadales bacterium]
MRAPRLPRLLLYYGLLALAVFLLARWFPVVSQAFSLARLETLAGQARSLVGASGAAPVGLAAAGPIEAGLLAGLAMTGALALAIPVAWVYTLTKRPGGYDPSVVHTVIILPIVVAGIAIIVQNSLALAFSLAGIVAAVRFRNTLKDTKDAVYIFLAIGLGLAAGVQGLTIAFVMSLVFTLVILALGRFRVGEEPGSGGGGGGGGGGGKGDGDAPLYTNLLLVHATAGAAARGAVEAVLAEQAKRWKLAHIVPGEGERAALTYLVRPKKKISPGALLDAVRGRAATHISSAALESLTA